jgi:hypothetical protein
MEDIRIAHDVVGASGTDQNEVDILGDERFEKGPPGLLRDGRVSNSTQR